MKNITHEMMRGKIQKLFNSPYASQIDSQFYQRLYRIIYLKLDENLYIQHEENIRTQLQDCV
jgi:hypothetical protein